MRPIKFRGKTFDGQIVFGSYCYENLDDIGEIHSIIDEHGEENIVDPDTVAQLVGYDANGKEVYEGDRLIEEYVDGYVKEHIACLEGMTQDPETSLFYCLPFPAPFTTLKEDES